MLKIPTSCNIFFGSQVENYGTSKDLYPDLSQTETGFIQLSSIFNGNDENDRERLRFFFYTQQIWTEDMLDEFHIACGRFVRKLKKVVWKAKPANPNDTVAHMKLPMLMAKLDTMLVHVEEFVSTQGIWAALSEEGLEHFQNVSLTPTKSSCI